MNLSQALGGGSPKSIQHGVCTIGPSQGNGDATITSVNTAKSIILWGGQHANAGGDYEFQSPFMASVSFLNGTTVRASRGHASAWVTLYVRFTVVEYY